MDGEAPLRVAFLVHELGRSGGMAVVRAHARRLAALGSFETELVVTGPRPGPLAPEEDGVPVRALDDVRGEARDLAVATFWTTAESLWELDARRRVLFVQNLEQRFYREDEPLERLGAFGVLALPVDFVVIASHMRELLGALRPDARCLLVPNGIDKSVFAASERPPAGEGPLRVLVEGQPTLWWKGVGEAVAAVRAMREPARVTVAVHDPAEAGDLRADRVVGGLDAAGMAALYAEHDVLLKLSRFEGLPLPPLEAFHVGLPCVLTPFTGHEDMARHGENALLVGFDDIAGAAGALDRLARDRALLARLAAGARATAERWPGREESTRRMADALREIADQPPPPEDLAHLVRGQRAALELTREELRRRAVALDHSRGEVAWHRGAYEQALRTVEEIGAERDRLAATVAQLNQDIAGVYARIDDIRAERAYRMAARARTALRRVTLADRRRES